MMNMHLQERIISYGPSLAESRAVVILVHGRNQTAHDMVAVAQRFHLPDVHFVALQAAGNSWYPSGFMAELTDNEPYLSEALDCYHTRIDELFSQRIAKTQIVLLGFSQGACLTAEYAVRHPDRYGGIVLFTGGIIGPQGTKWNAEGSFHGTPVFLGSSDVDSWVPEPRVHETGEWFKKMGAVTTTKIYKGMDHIINDDEIEIAKSFIQRVQETLN